MFVQFIHVLLIIMYINILIVHNILVVKKILLAMYNVVVVVTLDKTRNSLFLFSCQALSNFVTFIDYLNY